MKRICPTLFLALLLPLFCRCGGVQGVSVQKDKAEMERELRDAVSRFWECRIAEDYLSAYGFMEPSFKEEVTIQSFLRSKGTLEYKEFSIHKVNVDGDSGKATVLYLWKPKVPGLPAKEKWGRAEETWRYTDNRWYRMYSDRRN